MGLHELVKIEKRSTGNQIVLLVKTPWRNENWIECAKGVGARWKHPYADDAWQIIIPAYQEDAWMGELKAKLEIYYPNNGVSAISSSEISLDRSSSVEAKAKAETETISTAKIAEAVARVVTSRVDRQVTVLKEDVNARIASALALSNESVAKVNARLDLVLRPVIVHINNEDKSEEIRDLGVCHRQLSELIELIQALDPEERNIWVAGPVGGGKTTAARQVSEALGLLFEFNGAIDTEYKLSGFIDAQGRVISTSFRRSWENGGVYLFDEVDASMPAAVLAFNAALANGHAAFPDRTLMRHPNTIVIAAANTWGFGGDANYVGRMKQDATFLDRFITLSWEYDEALERARAANDEWVDAVQGTRRLAREKGAQILASPRSSIKGAQLLRNKNISRRRVVHACFGRYESHKDWPMISHYLRNFEQSL